jgi:hypothetical protein
MKVLLLGATGMIGQGVLRECLLDDGVESVIAIGRSATGKHHQKLREILRNELSDFSDINSRERLRGVASTAEDAESLRLRQSLESFHSTHPRVLPSYSNIFDKRFIHSSKVVESKHKESILCTSAGLAE